MWEKWIRRALPIGAMLAGMLVFSGPAAGLIPAASPQVQLPKAPPRLQPTAQLASTVRSTVRTATGAAAPVTDITDAAARAPAQTREVTASAPSGTSARSAAPSPSSGQPSPGYQAPAPSSPPEARAAAGHRHRDVAARHRADRRLRSVVKRLSGCLGRVGHTERRVLVLRAGVGDARALSRAAVARRLEIPSGRVARAERHGIRRLRALSQRHGCASGARKAPLPSAQAVVARPGPRLVAAADVETAVDSVLTAAPKRGGSGGSSAKGGQERHGLQSRLPAASNAEDSDPAHVLWLLVLAGVLVLATLIGRNASRLRPVQWAPPPEPVMGHPPLMCPVCGSKRHAVNPAVRAYRCLDCHHRGQIPS